LLLAQLNADPAAAVAFGRIQQFDETGEIETPPPRRAPDEGSLLNLLIDNPIAQSAALVRREQLFAVAGYREEMEVAEDYDLWLRLAEEHALLPVESVTCRYRLHHNQTSRSLLAMIRFGWKARMDSRKRLQDKGIYLPEHEAALRIAVSDDTITAWVASDLESMRALLAIAESIEHAGVLRQAIRARMLLLPAKRLLRWKPHLRSN
jgi:hypothetical protein